MPALIIDSGKHKGKKLLLPQGDIVIGRDEVCQIRLGSSDVSRRHCVLRPQGEGFLVRDLNSRNGTLINGIRIQQESPLQPGDLLEVGPIAFRVPGEKPAASPGPASKKAVASEPAAMARPAPPEPGRTTDDDIAGWLTYDDAGADENPTGGTTIVGREELEQRKQELPRGSDSEVSSVRLQSTSPPPYPERKTPAPARSEKKTFRSVAEEARDIISRWMDEAENE